MNASPIVKQRSLYLDIARVLAIISISINHAVNRTYDNYDGQLAEFLSLPMGDTLIKTAITVFSKVGVPLFLMISGALLMNKPMEDSKDVKRFYKHNLLSLFITAELWYFIMYWFKMLLGIGDESLWDTGIAGSLEGMVRTMLFLDQNTFPSMWYMPMILCIYTTLPFITIVKNKLGDSKQLLWLPAGLSFLYFMVLPAVSAFSQLSGGNYLKTVVREPNLLSLYYVYVLAGYFIHEGVLKKAADWLIATMTVFFFLACCAFQLYAYSKPADYLIDYNFPLLVFYAGFQFEWIRRKGHLLERFRKVISYLSKASLGIYFIHIMIVVVLTWLLKDMGKAQVWRLLVLEIVPVGLSILIIALFSKIKWIRQYLFGMK